MTANSQKGRKAIILFECVIKTKFLGMLKGLVPIRDFFFMRSIYCLILPSFNELQFKSQKL